MPSRRPRRRGGATRAAALGAGQAVDPLVPVGRREVQDGDPLPLDPAREADRIEDLLARKTTVAPAIQAGKISSMALSNPRAENWSIRSPGPRP
jgi:hypothetical protein